jgi:hypothetical protein
MIRRLLIVIRWRIGMAVLLALALAATSCFLPEEFLARITVNGNGTHTFAYDGVLTFVLARAALAEGSLSKSDQAPMKQGEVELRKDPWFKKVNYIDQGRCEVLFETALRGG